MRSIETARNQAERGQSAVEFLFIVIFFMTLVSFVRALTLFELDVFNQSNTARYKILKYIRGTEPGGESFGNEENTKPKEITGKSFQKISSGNLRNILFLKFSGANYRLPEREYYFWAGTKYGDAAAPFATGTQAAVIVLMGISP